MGLNVFTVRLFFEYQPKLGTSKFIIFSRGWWHSKHTNPVVGNTPNATFFCINISGYCATNYGHKNKTIFIFDINCPIIYVYSFNNFTPFTATYFSPSLQNV